MVGWLTSVRSRLISRLSSRGLYTCSPSLSLVESLLLKDQIHCRTSNKLGKSLFDNNCSNVNVKLCAYSTSTAAAAAASVNGVDAAFSAIELALDSVVKIFTVSSSPNYFLPWQNKSQRESMGSGFVISGNRILTNAHVVADHTFVLVRKHGSPAKYRAEVQAIGHECDLAILVVESQDFWDRMTFLELGDIPFLQEAVAVVGYPQGGDNISVTKGVVSRVEPTQYVHGAAQLMAIQIDAAINPGNSGGPAIMGNKVAGVAFQNLSGAENIGYIIPVPVIKHFIAGVEESGKYAGFCSLGLSCQPTENVQLRSHFGMLPEMTGVLVSKINPLSDAHRILKKDDIILAFDGVPIANDGTVPFRNRERITFDHLVSMKKSNETASLRVLRGGEEHDFIVTLRPLQPLVPVHQFDKLPSYYIFAGLVFVPLSQPYLHEYGEDWYNNSPRRLCERALRELPKKAGQQLVILSQVLMDDINAGYERLAELQVKKLNGVEVENLKHLCQLVENCSTESLRVDLDDDRVIILNYRSAKVATSKILKRHRIPSVISSDLISEQNNSEIDLACSS
ncbi:Trypsin domain-containing protein/PDZ_2 domain-containing protein [Cephalotus follicularis]|uniref:Trypsin domain-containing protein/PDZ_2 domain-containing protein n=1 Tax=Cephalotus follicularis TaxID=3775 RepID=A0A1Q3CNT2_CEPFO|nr:Trypsin domain-containing protein/PDZ_2 domain-containing protein [Cephalotus follicularis]